MRYRELSVLTPGKFLEEKQGCLKGNPRQMSAFCLSLYRSFCGLLGAVVVLLLAVSCAAAEVDDEIFLEESGAVNASNSGNDQVFIESDADSYNETEIGEGLAYSEEETEESEGVAVSAMGECAEGAEILDVKEVNQFSRDNSVQQRFNSVMEEEFPEENDSHRPEAVDLKADLAERITNGAIDPRFELFQNFDSTSEWASMVESETLRAFDLLETNPAGARNSLRRLSSMVVKSNLAKSEFLLPGEYRAFDKGNSSFAHSNADFVSAPAAEKYALPLLSAEQDEEVFTSSAERTKPTGLAHYAPEERVEIYRNFRYALDRRIYLWAAAADYFEYAAAGGIQEGRAITKKDITDLKEKTEAVRNYFGVSNAGQMWRKSLEVDILWDILDQFDRKFPTEGGFTPYETAPVPNELDEEAAAVKEEHLLRAHINSICRKIESFSWTPSQQDVFKNSAAGNWYQALRQLRCDQADPYKILDLYEIYERNGGGDVGRELGEVAYRMKNSPSEPCQKFGEAVTKIYNNPNLKVYISQAFINRFLPIRDPEFDVVQERILGNPVAGSRRTDTQVRIQLVPDPQRLLMNLVVDGRVVASTRSEVFPAKIFNESYANYSGVKEIEWGNSGFSWRDAVVDVNNTNKLSDIRTNVDFVPIVGSLAREVVKGEYHSKQEALRQAAHEKIVTEVKRRIDTESSERFEELNSQLAEKFFARLDKLGLSLAMQNARTTQDWLLASMRLSEPGALGSQTVEPPSLGGTFADIKVHESAVNTFLSRLEIGGKSWTPEELVNHIAAKFDREAPAYDYGDIFLEFGMSQTDPIAVSFDENRIRLKLRFDYVEMGDQGWDNVDVTVTYLTEVNENGTPLLVRDGVINVSGPMNIRAQIPLRGLFSKIFPQEKEILLRPKLFDNDERFAGLSTGLCRVKNGWFAVSVVEKESKVMVSEYPRLKAFRERLSQRSRVALKELSSSAEKNFRQGHQGGIIH